MATRWRWPPESWRGRRSSSLSSSRMRAVCVTRWRIFRELADFQAIGHVVEHAHVRVQGVVLKHHGDVALGRLQVVDECAVDQNLAVGDGFQTGHHAHQCGFAAS